MEQIKYILHSALILASAAVTYLVMKPMVESQWVKTESNEPVYGSNESYTEPKIENVAGKNLFLANCQTCHSIYKVLTGPALADVESRGPWTERKNLVKWMKNPAAFIPTTTYTTNLAAEYNGQVMPSFPHLSEGQIAQIFDYINEASAQPLQSVQ